MSARCGRVWGEPDAPAGDRVWTWREVWQRDAGTLVTVLVSLVGVILLVVLPWALWLWRVVVLRDYTPDPWGMSVEDSPAIRVLMGRWS